MGLVDTINYIIYISRYISIILFILVDIYLCYIYIDYIIFIYIISRYIKEITRTYSIIQGTIYIQYFVTIYNGK